MVLDLFRNYLRFGAAMVVLYGVGSNFFDALSIGFSKTTKFCV